MNKIEKARKLMKEALVESGDLYQGYQANIAMCIYDNRRKDGRLNHSECNDVAKKLIYLVCGSEET